MADLAVVNNAGLREIMANGLGFFGFYLFIHPLMHSRAENIGFDCTQKMSNGLWSLLGLVRLNGCTEWLAVVSGCN